MLQKILAVSAAVFLLAACEQSQTAAVAPPTPAPTPAPESFMVYFNSGQTTLSSEDTATIQQAASAYKPGATVAVTGHADTTGSQNLNLELAQHRTATVRDALVRDGVPPTAIMTQGHGEMTLPVQTAQNVNERRNRSVEIAVVQAPLMSDSQYCAALSAQYRKYNARAIDEQASHAMSQCPTADAAAAIPVLEQHVQALNVALPSRVLPRS